MKKWNTTLDASNPDLVNLLSRLGELEFAGLLSPSARIFAVGMSNGGAFVSRLSQLMALQAMDLPRKRSFRGN